MQAPNQSNNFYPYGMTMPGRKGSLVSYKYGFGGKEQDPEVSGEGNSYDFGARMYSSRLGRFNSVDPYYAHNNSPYNYAGNSPIWAIDYNGLYPIPVTVIDENGQERHFVLKVNRFNPQKIKIIDTDSGEKMVHKFTSQDPSRKSLQIFVGDYDNVVDDSSPDVQNLRDQVFSGVKVNDILNQVLIENPELKLIIIGNHKISGVRALEDRNDPASVKGGYGSIFRHQNEDGTEEAYYGGYYEGGLWWVVSPEGPISVYGMDPYEVQKIMMDIQVTFTYNRAQTVKDEIFTDVDNVIVQGRAQLDDLGKEIKISGVEIAPLGRDPVGVTIFIDLSQLKTVKKRRREEKKTNKQQEKKKNKPVQRHGNPFILQ